MDIENTYLDVHQRKSKLLRAVEKFDDSIVKLLDILERIGGYSELVENIRDNTLD